MAAKFVNGLDMASTKIVNVTDPTSAQDASTKNYADVGVAAGKKFSLAMSMITGV